MAFFDSHPPSPISTPFDPFLLIATMDSHTLVWALVLGDGLPFFCLTIVKCPMQGRITTDEDAWLHHKWKPEVGVDSLVQATLPPGPVEDEVDTYEALALASRVSELSNKATPEHSDFVIS